MTLLTLLIGCRVGSFQAASVADRFSRSSFEFGMKIEWHVHCEWLPLFLLKSLFILRAGQFFRNLTNLALPRSNSFLF